ncbi:MAG TPA: ImmA/IrrE family metallo-endopeptidase [Kofleriaceae bacterium]|jgi:hypothetical protein
MRGEGLRDAQRCAKGLLHRFGVREAGHIRIEAFAARLGAEIQETALDGAAAQLVRHGKRAIIYVAERITDPAARRFSIAHELGHLALEHPSMPPHELSGRYSLVASVDEGRRDYEAEANAFAAEMLMPTALLTKTCEVSPVDLAVPRQIAREYNVSILASARRFTELASERCAAVFSVDREVKWVAPSATFMHEIPRGKRVDTSSLAWDYFARGSIPDEPQPVPADAWFDTATDVDIIEHSIYSSELRTVLTMLWVPECAAPRLGWSEK